MKRSPESDAEKWEQILEFEGLGVIRPLTSKTNKSTCAKNKHVNKLVFVSNFGAGGSYRSMENTTRTMNDSQDVQVDLTRTEAMDRYWHDFSERVNDAIGLTTLEMDFLYRYCEHGNRSRAARETGMHRKVAEKLVARFAKEN